MDWTILYEDKKYVLSFTYSNIMVEVFNYDIQTGTDIKIGNILLDEKYKSVTFLELMAEITDTIEFLKEN